MSLALVLLCMQAVSCGTRRRMPEKPPPTEQTGPGKETPKTGDSKAPVKKSPRKILTDSLDRVYPVTLKDKYVVAVFLPFYLRDAALSQKEKSEINVAKEFYRGLLVGADTLKKCGLNLDLHVFDSEAKRNTHSYVSAKLQSIGADLVIGPLLESRMNFLDSLAEALRINHVAPLMSPDKCRPNRKYYFESVPNSAAIIDSLTRFMDRQYPEYNRILVNERYTTGNDLAELFVKSHSRGSLTIIDFKDYGASTYKPDFMLKEKNIIFIPTRNEIFISGLLAQLRLNTQEIIVIGTLPWTFFRSIEGDLWERFKIHIPAQYFLNYHDPALAGFIESYRQRYNEEPGTWSFIGFDEIVFYGKKLQQSGRYFQRAMVESANREKLLHSTYRFRYDKQCGGWKNTFLNILRFENWELMPIPLTFE